MFIVSITLINVWQTFYKVIYTDYDQGPLLNSPCSAAYAPVLLRIRHDQ